VWAARVTNRLPRAAASERSACRDACGLSGLPRPVFELQAIDVAEVVIIGDEHSASRQGERRHPHIIDRNRSPLPAKLGLGLREPFAYCQGNGENLVQLANDLMIEAEQFLLSSAC